MSAILSADDLNDFISPSVACIKPVETIPIPIPSNAYEVTTEDKVPHQPQTAQISLTDCLACSGCVTSAEAVLVSLQSHTEVLNILDSGPQLFSQQHAVDSVPTTRIVPDGKILVASVSQQVRASIAATYRVSEKEAGAMIENLLSGPEGITNGGQYGNRFTWVVDINPFREIALSASARELNTSTANSSVAESENMDGLETSPKTPILTSACPGWVCYAEKTHPHVLPHLSRVKSPQALAGTLLKSTLSAHYAIDPARIWHLAIMPCFDKKLEASRQELTDASWRNREASGAPVRDVDCVITARELLMLADSRGIRFPDLPRAPPADRPAFPDPIIDGFLFETGLRHSERETLAGTSGGFLYQMLSLQSELSPGNRIEVSRGRNADVLDLSVVTSSNSTPVFRGARYYGFRNIQNLVRRLKPAATGRMLPGTKAVSSRRSNTASTKGPNLAYVEVMACPGGCTNGGGQIKVSDLSELQSPLAGLIGRKEWQDEVENAYFSTSSLLRDSAYKQPVIYPEVSSSLRADMMEADSLINHWSQSTGIPESKLLFTTFRAVESNVGQLQQDIEKVASLASKMGGGW